MKETMLAAIFVIHATVFAYFYLRRGRRAFNLLFCGGFILLAGYYAYNCWQFFAGVESGLAWLHYFRWAGLILCALATPFFLTHLFRKRRAKSLRSGRC
jgi:TRAP-type C4-dicarboxylate transport system permease small subunit